MDVEGVLRIALPVVLVVLAAVGVWGAIEVARAARSVRTLSDGVARTLPPVIEHAGATLERADVTLDALRDELARMNGVVTSLEEVSDRVKGTTRAVEEIVEAPAAAVSGMAQGVRSFFSVLTGRRL